MKKILVVEDDKFLQNIYSVKLPKAGYETKIVGDGNEAIEILKTYSPDIILMDIIMPGKDGYSTLEELRKDPKYKNIPIIVSSNLGQKDEKEKSLKLGATDYVIKSDISLTDFIEKIASYI